MKKAKLRINVTQTINHFVGFILLIFVCFNSGTPAQIGGIYDFSH